MNSLLRTVTLRGGRENVFKESLSNQLSESVKDIQLEHYRTPDDLELSSGKEATTSLCTVLEAIFIHGLKDTFLNRMTQVIGGDPDQHPQPSFWGPSLIFSHREIIDQINSLNLITTDVGRCRAWLRVAVNDCLLSRYLEAMRQDGSALKPYYRSSAFVRDPEYLEVAQHLIEGIEAFPFSLTFNSSLLNVWTSTPLLLAGLWTPPLRACPVIAGVDVASTLDDNFYTRKVQEDTPSSTVSLASSYQGSGIGQVLPFSEDEVLKIILGTPVNDSVGENSNFGNVTNTGPLDIPVENNGNIQLSQATDIPPRHTKNGVINGDDAPSSVGNSLIGRVGWSSSFEEVSDKLIDNSIDSEETARGEKSKTKTLHKSSNASRLRSSGEAQSYHSLLESYNLQYARTPDMHEFLNRFENSVDSVNKCGADSDDPFSAVYSLGFEIVPSSPTSLFDIPEFPNLVLQLGKLAKESGLDSQNYTCKGCGNRVGMNFGKARVCGFTGDYYCQECHIGEEWVIPAKVIYNWDFRRYPVSKKSSSFLNDIQHHPLIDLKVLNPVLYFAVEEMSQLQTLRIQLNLLRAYLFTCREPVIEDLQKRVWPREYLYEHVHLYSLSDLYQIPSGTLVQMLQRIVAFGRDHVLTCWLCSQKGFICEVCNNPKVIYPFDVDVTFRCAACSAVYHQGCLNSMKPCPKCKRRQQRESTPPLAMSTHDGLS